MGVTDDVTPVEVSLTPGTLRQVGVCLPLQVISEQKLKRRREPFRLWTEVWRALLENACRL
jgi:hypothetical protein